MQARQGVSGGPQLAALHSRVGCHGGGCQRDRRRDLAVDRWQPPASGTGQPWQGRHAHCVHLTGVLILPSAWSAVNPSLSHIWDTAVPSLRLRHHATITLESLADVSTPPLGDSRALRNTLSPDCGVNGKLIDAGDDGGVVESPKMGSMPIQGPRK